MNTLEASKRLVALVVLGGLGWLVASKAPMDVREALTSANGAIWALLAWLIQSPIPSRTKCDECGKPQE